ARLGRPGRWAGRGGPPAGRAVPSAPGRGGGRGRNARGRPLSGTGGPLAAYFEHLLFSCFLKTAKPEPDCFRAALGVLGASPSDVVFLDDRAENVAAAAALGIRSLRFTDAAAARAGLAACGVAGVTE